jgi:hypothetical protein
MNERAKQLALQALKHPDNDNDGLTVFDNDELEKFAELIIKECIGCCEQVISDPVPNYYIDTWLNGGSQCIDEIKQHFGVEE